MKFDCGLSAIERIRRDERWHKYFTWWPVRVGSRDCRWLEYIERRYSGGEYCFMCGWEYRPLRDK